MPYLGALVAAVILGEVEDAHVAIYGSPFPETDEARAALAHLRRFLETYYLDVDDRDPFHAHSSTGSLTTPQIAILSGLPEVHLWTTKEVQPDRALLARLPRELAEKHCALPLQTKHVKGVLHAVVALAVPNRKDALADIEAALQLPVFQVIAYPSHIQEAIKMYYSG
ncbi:MAG: hypothetical protein KJ062_03495 [Thermoanaerobaculia bacterium]|nr:hypothetical protein [Thermoanaerobaculia bacterium]